MGADPIDEVPCAKGAVCYCLDEFSKGPGARSRIRNLNEAITQLAPTYMGLEDVFDKYLLSRVIKDPAERRRIVAHLKAFWFDSDAPEPFFPHRHVVQVYAEGLCKTLELALNGRRRVVPINAWWILDCAELRMLNLANVNEDGQTIGGNVTLLIMTPRPQFKGRRSRGPTILGKEAQAWVTEQQGDRVTTRRVRDIRPPD